jgi:hypothetical protein
MPDLPARFAALIITVAPLSVQRSCCRAQVPPIGAILAPGGRAVAIRHDPVRRERWAARTLPARQRRSATAAA